MCFQHTRFEDCVNTAAQKDDVYLWIIGTYSL